MTLSTPGVFLPLFSVTRFTAKALPENERVSSHCKAFTLPQRPSRVAFTIRACNVFAEVNTAKKQETRARQERACLRPEFDAVRDKPLLETTRQDILTLLHRLGAYARNIFRVYYNYARDMDYLTENILPRPLWPKPKAAKKRRAITREEHQRIVGAEQNPEHRLYYMLAWELGAAQTDLATMQAENIDWQNRTLRFYRRKTGTMSAVSIGPTLEALLRQLPAQGPLFPKLSRITSQARSAEFCRRCRVLKIEGVSLHSYRYSWAQRAKEAGYPERWAKAHLGHKSSAIHEHYASGDGVVITSLEDFQAKVIPFERAEQVSAQAG